jgi:diadenosine tetraphosphatase ApaH/serine/threonine PP2A family protein phosphatase
MKVQLLSDLHCVFWERRGFGDENSFERLLETIQTDARVLVIAGDAQFTDLEGNLRRLAQAYKSVVYLPGNHEFYGGRIGVDLPRFYALENKLVAEGLDIWIPRAGMTQSYGGVRFIGGIMWQPWGGPEHPSSKWISDHDQIKDFRHRAREEFADFHDYLKQELREGDFVVTHHSPSYQSCAEEFLDSDCNRWFHTPEIEYLMERRPVLWHHGHTHSPFDYRHQPSGVRVVCNPRGYPGEGVDFNPRLVVEL